MTETQKEIERIEKAIKSLKNQQVIDQQHYNEIQHDLRYLNNKLWHLRLSLRKK